MDELVNLIEDLDERYGVWEYEVEYRGRSVEITIHLEESIYDF